MWLVAADGLQAAGGSLAWSREVSFRRCCRLAACCCPPRLTGLCSPPADAADIIERKQDSKTGKWRYYVHYLECEAFVAVLFSLLLPLHIAAVASAAFAAACPACPPALTSLWRHPPLLPLLLALQNSPLLPLWLYLPSCRCAAAALRTPPTAALRPRRSHCCRRLRLHPCLQSTSGWTSGWAKSGWPPSPRWPRRMRCTAWPAAAAAETWGPWRGTRR